MLKLLEKRANKTGKIITSIALCAILVLGGFVFNLGSAIEVTANTQQVRVMIDGRQVSFPDQQPVIINGRTFVPVRGVFEELGFEVDWISTSQTATLDRGTGVEIQRVRIPIGMYSFTINNVTHRFDVPSQTINGRTMIPLRALVEGVGYNIDWDDSTSTVIITTRRDNGGSAQQPANDGRIITTARQVSQTTPTINIHGMELTREQFQGLVVGRYYVCVENPGRHELVRAQGSDLSVRPYVRYSGYSEKDFTYGAAFYMLSQRNQQFSGAGSRRNGVITLFYFIDAERRWEVGNPPAWVNGVLGNTGQPSPNQ